MSSTIIDVQNLKKIILDETSKNTPVIPNDGVIMSVSARYIKQSDTLDDAVNLFRLQYVSGEFMKLYKQTKDLFAERRKQRMYDRELID